MGIDIRNPKNTKMGVSLYNEERTSTLRVSLHQEGLVVEMAGGCNFLCTNTGEFIKYLPFGEGEVDSLITNLSPIVCLGKTLSPRVSLPQYVISCMIQGELKVIPVDNGKDAWKKFYEITKDNKEDWWQLEEWGRVFDASYDSENPDYPYESESRFIRAFFPENLRRNAGGLRCLYIDGFSEPTFKD